MPDRSSSGIVHQQQYLSAAMKAIAMAEKRVHPSFSSLLACTLLLSSGRFTLAQDVMMASDDAGDFPSSYRYVMNGSELSTLGIGSISLVPLSQSLWNLSPEDFSATVVGGNLQNVNVSTATGLPPFTIPYISCDDADAVKIVGESFNSTDVRNVLAAVLYSQLHTHCNISNALAMAGWLNLLTVSDKREAQQVAELELNDNSLGIIQIIPDISSLPPGTKIHPPRKGSPIPMIILYALTSIITVLLLIVIIGGAIKARRHPERYGPRNIMGRPRRSRAKGIAKAMLETLPIVRFGDPDPKQPKSMEGERDIEMTPTAQPTQVEEKEPKPGRASNEAEQTTSAPAADTSTATTTQLAATDEASPSSPSATTNNNTIHSHPPPAPPAPTTPQDTNPPTIVDSSPSCSICTEDFNRGEPLRVLPCNHKFHPLCVDPWLLNVSGTCPLCRIDLRPPQESFDDNEDTAWQPATAAASGTLNRRRMFGGVMRGPRGLDLQAIVEASREERIRLLRRWREERRMQNPNRPGVERSRSRSSVTANTDARRRRSRPLSQWFGDARSSPRVETGGASGGGRRPRTWYAGEAAGSGSGSGSGTVAAADQAPQLPPMPGNAATLDERARTWYAGADSGAAAAAAVAVAAPARGNENEMRNSEGDARTDERS